MRVLVACEYSGAVRDAERLGCRFAAAYLSGMAAGFAEHLIAAGLE